MLVGNEFEQDTYRFTYDKIVILFFIYQKRDEDLRYEFFIYEPFFKESLSYHFDQSLFFSGDYRLFTSLLTKLAHYKKLPCEIVC